jgi:hypothetical protein
MPSAPAMRVVAAFADAAAARGAESALIAAGTDAERIVVAGAGTASPAPPAEREEHFFLRLVIVVGAWSVAGTLAGVVMGVVFAAAGIGPQGASGIVIQVASWAIFAHLIAGLWAGYALLTRGESRNPATRIRGGRAVVSVACADPAACVGVEGELRRAGATAVARYDVEGRRASER